MLIHQLLEISAQKHPYNIAVEDDKGHRITYQNLNVISNILRDRFEKIGVRPGDRVGICLRKSIDAVATIFGILKTGAIYVPIDPDAPPARNVYILSDCNVKVVALEKKFEDGLLAGFRNIDKTPSFLVIEDVASAFPLDYPQEQALNITVESANVTPEDIAYIIYTSGSTGMPKGVMLSHQNATSFIEWCSEKFNPVQKDRFSSHAPFHFDLSILDIYLPIAHGATLVLIGSEIGKDPTRLGKFISESKITSWYSTPSTLSLLAQYGKLQQHDYSSLRTVLFAGEVFPIKHLRTLQLLLPKPRYFNLYGPTETNVCTYYEIPNHITEERNQPYPIGKVCSHLKGIVVDDQGREIISIGQEGELCISGLGVMKGYWNLPDRTAQSFLTDAVGRKWYKTGDIVMLDEVGNYVYVGRRDRMVKKRGYRVELDEIETVLYRHHGIKEVAVIALSNEEDGVRIKVFLSCKEEMRPSIIELKRFCAENLPIYMVPDFFTFLDNLPKTSTNKVDYQKLIKLY